jgi:hypothetical protein
MPSTVQDMAQNGTLETAVSAIMRPQIETDDLIEILYFLQLHAVSQPIALPTVDKLLLALVYTLTTNIDPILELSCRIVGLIANMGADYMVKIFQKCLGDRLVELAPLYLGAA